MEAYQAVRAGGFESPDLHYNLGNAYFQMGELGQSILGWERALKLAPGHADALANLELAVRLSADDIVFGQTHTHAGPDLQGLWGGVPQDWIDNTLYAGAEAALAEAEKANHLGDDGNIERVAKTMAGPKERVRRMLLPAGFDMHVHFRDPGFPQKETWASGSAAAACGGVTAVVDMPNTQPPTDSPAAFAAKAQRAAAPSVVDFGLGVGARPGISREAWFGELPAAFWKLYPYGKSWDDYRATAREVTAAGGRPLVIHGEHPSHIDMSPPRKLAEHTAHRRLAEAECLAGMPASPQLHVAHLSTADGLAGLPAGATAEVCPHHLTITDRWVLGNKGAECGGASTRAYDTSTKVYPPLRGGAQDAMGNASNTVPYHPAAIAFFQEKGLWSDANEAREASFTQ